MFGHFRVLRMCGVFHLKDWKPNIGLVVFISNVCNDLIWILFESINSGAAYRNVDNIILVDKICFVLKLQYRNISLSMDDL